MTKLENGQNVSMLLDLEDYAPGLALREIWERLTKVT